MTTQLRSCTADVSSPAELGMDTYYLGTTKHVPCPDAHVLRSYNSIVAMIDGNAMILFPRYDYSSTTMLHVRRFVEDYASIKYPQVKAMRECLKTGADYEGYSVFADAQFLSYGKMRTY